METYALRLALAGALLVLASCNERQPLRESNVPAARIDTVSRFNPMRELPEAPSRDQLASIVRSAVGEMKRARYSDLPAIRKYIQRLALYPAVTETLEAIYRQEPAQDYDSRAFILGVLGEMRRADALPFLLEMAWGALPQPTTGGCGLSARDLEEMVTVKAVEGIAYLRSPEAFREILKIIREHESDHVKISAIDSYMWNSGDTQEAAKWLYQRIPADLHKFVGRPRFQKNMDSKVFQRRLSDWIAKWGGSPQHK